MAQRLTSRLSAGAALVTGLGMAGIATAVPAQAATELVYTCTTAIGDKPLTVAIDTDAPETVAAGETLSVSSISGTVTLPSDVSNAVAGFLGAEYMEGTTPVTTSVTSGGETVGEVSTTLLTERTHIFTAGEGWAQEGIDPANPQVWLPLASSEVQSIQVPAEAIGSTFELQAPETFTSAFTGTKADGSTFELDVPCTYESGNKVIDAVSVVETTEEPTEPEPEPEPTAPEPTEPAPTEPAPTEPTEPTDPQPTTPAPAGPAEPEVPEVVQTDGLTQAGQTGDEQPVAFALGGLLLAGAGAGTVLVARRRASQH